MSDVAFNTFIQGRKGDIKLTFIPIGTQNALHESLSFISVEIVGLVCVELWEDLHRDFLDVSFSGELTVFDKAIVFLEVGLRIEHNFDIVMHALPSYLSLVTQVFTIDAHDLATVVLGLSGARSTSVNDFNLASAHVGVLAFVSLDATSFLSISKHAGNSCKFVNLGVADPSNID